MRHLLSVHCLNLLLLSTPLLMVSENFLPTASAETVAAGRKTVTVFASNETEAVATAERQNPQWKAVSAIRSAPKDPLSKGWIVTMTKD